MVETFIDSIETTFFAGRNIPLSAEAWLLEAKSSWRPEENSTNSTWSPAPTLRLLQTFTGIAILPLEAIVTLDMSTDIFFTKKLGI